MHLVIPGVVAHLYHIHRTLNQRGEDMEWIFLEFHQEIVDWQARSNQTVAWTNHLDEIVCQ